MVLKDHVYYEHICENGHGKIENDVLSSVNKFCERCGAEMLNKCPSCGRNFKVWDFTRCGGYAIPKFERPLYCISCGAPYPWTTSAIENAKLLIFEDSQLNDSDKEAVGFLVPDIIAETPKTQTAIITLQKALKIAGKFTADGIRQFVIDFGCELAKKQFGL